MKRVFSVLLVLFFLVGSSEIVFSKGGGSSSGGGHSFSGGSKSFSGGSKSFSGTGSGKSFSGKGSAGESKAGRPGFDSGAGKAQSKAASAEKYSNFKMSKGIESRTYNPNLSSTRDVRSTQTFSNRQPTGYYTPSTTVVVYHDYYNNNFLMYASMFWLFNHWDNIDHSRFQDAKIKELELKFKELEAQGKTKDPKYNEPGVDSDLQYHKDAVKYGHTSVGKVILTILIVVAIIAAILFVVWYVFYRRRIYD